MKSRLDLTTRIITSSQNAKSYYCIRKPSLRYSLPPHRLNCDQSALLREAQPPQLVKFAPGVPRVCTSTTRASATKIARRPHSPLPRALMPSSAPVSAGSSTSPGRKKRTSVPLISRYETYFRAILNSPFTSSRPCSKRPQTRCLSCSASRTTCPISSALQSVPSAYRTRACYHHTAMDSASKVVSWGA